MTGRTHFHRKASQWLNQARLGCGETARLELFNMARLRSAARDFAARLRYLSGGR